MNLELQITAGADTAPKLAELMRTLDPAESDTFFGGLASEFERLTSEHITRAAQSRHKTAERLGAQPTRYLERAAQSVETRGVRGGRVSITLQGDIFARAFGSVTVTAQKAKMLTIPWRAEAYGKRAGEFKGLFVYTSKRGQAFLAQRAERGIEFLFLLKKSVVLPQDRGLLPSNDEYLAAAEVIAAQHVERMLKALA